MLSCDCRSMVVVFGVDVDEVGCVDEEAPFESRTS
jgi:hypothetical protein